MKNEKDFAGQVKRVLADAPKDIEGVAFAAECYLYKFDERSLTENE